MNRGNLDTPTLWLVAGFRGSDLSIVRKALMTMRIPCLFTTAYEILMDNNKESKIRKTGIHKFLEFSGPIMMDSGGFMFRGTDELPIDQLSILDFQRKASPDIAIILDHALDLERPHTNLTRLDTTFKNARIALENRGELELMPVIHLSKPSIVRKFIKKYEKMGNFITYGIGNFRPFPLKFNRWKRMLNMIIKIRRELKDKYLHCFGVGSALTMYMLACVNIDSMDSSSWVKKAGFGKIQLPGQGETFVQKRKGRKKCRYVDWDSYHCNCPICKNCDSLELKIKLESSKTQRALHNAYVYLAEMSSIRKSLKEDTYQELITQKYSCNPLFKKLNQYINKMKSK